MLSFFRVPFRIVAAILFIPALASAQNAAAPKPPAAKPASAAPPVSKNPKEWAARFGKIAAAKSMDAKTQADFDGLDADAAYQIYRETFPQIKNEAVRRGVFRIVLAKTKDPTVIEREPARLLSVLDISLQDTSATLGQTTLQSISPLLLRSFATPKEWQDWRKANGDKPLPQILREDCELLAGTFLTAPPERKTEIFNLMGRAAYQNGYALERADGKMTRRLKAVGLNALRRKAVADSGLFDALTLPLRGSATDELAERSLRFVRAYRPDEPQMQRIEPALRRQLEAQFTLPESQIDGSIDLLFACKGEWAMPLLVKAAQNNYLTGGSRVIVSTLTRARDVRALPLLIELLPDAIGQQAAQIKAALEELLLKPEPNNVLAKRDADGWRAWWAKNRADYPADAQNLTLGPLKTGAEAALVRLQNNTQQYGMDSSAMQGFQALQTEEQYRVLQGAWGLELPAETRQQLLSIFASNGGDPNPKDPKHAKTGNPRLLDALYLGMTDADGDVQQTASQILFQKTLQLFPDAASFLRWRKRSVGRPLKELVTEGAKAFVTRLAAAPEGDKGEMFGKLAQGIQFHSGTKIETKEGKTVRTVTVNSDVAERRKILLDGGIIAQAAALLLSRNEAAANAAANFLELFQPDDADLPKIEPGIKQAYTRWIAQNDGQNTPNYSFMLLFHGAWVGDLLTQAVQNSSGTVSFRRQGPLPELMQSEDKRTIPLLISGVEAQPKPQKPQTLQRLAKLTGVKFDAKQDGAFWRKWWDANKATLPEEARAIKIASVKSPKEVLLERLIAGKDGLDWDTYFQFEMADSETQWAVLSEGWKKITNSEMKSFMLTMVSYMFSRPTAKLKPGEANRRLLELYGLAIADTNEAIRKSASTALINYALRDIKDAAVYTAWRKEIGDKPLEQVIKQETRDALTALQKPDAKMLTKTLELLNQVDWGSRYRDTGDDTQPVTAQGLTGVRRNAALEMKFPDTLLRLLRNDQAPEVNQKALTLLHSFLPGRATFAAAERDATRILPLLLNKSSNERFSFYSPFAMLMAYHEKWATDLLLATAKKRYMEDSFSVEYILCSAHTPRVVPTLIAILDDQGGEPFMRYMVAEALSRLTHTTMNVNRSAAWWRAWWKDNRAQMPEEARNEPIPDLQFGNRYAKTLSIKRGRQLETIGHDGHKRYWRLSSGLLISEKTKKKAKAGANAGAITVLNNPAAKAKEPTGIPMAERPGLLVVLGDGDSDIAMQAGYWQDVAGRGFGGKYLVALVSPAKWREKQTGLWLTRKNRAEVPEAAFTTEMLAADVARDMMGKYPINPAHVYLVGAGAGGTAAYACSLEAQTPFHGFLLMQSAFRSAQLPPLANAKNRRYYLLHSRDNKKTPYFAATLAQNTLRTQGATVKLSNATANPDAEQPATWEEAAEGVKWLEKQ